MNRYLIGCAAACIASLAIGSAAQNPPPTPQSQPRQPQTSAPAAKNQTSKVTVEGCLVREQDVPGRKPNVAERAGVMEDYILTNAKVVKGSSPAAAPRAKAGEPTGTSGTASAMYDVKGIADERLKQFAGKKVQIEGTFADTSKSPSAGSTEDLVDIQGTSIRPASGDCSPK